MKHLSLSIAIAWAVIAMVIASANQIALTDAAERATAAPNSAVVVELFTSQGCSSCPPADRLISQLGDPQLRPRVIPLAFHVDYWDRLGWRDPFSSSAWTTRQQGYARAMGLNGTYTPQIVVAGSRQCVGSDQSKVMAAIQEEAKGQRPVKITITQADPSGGGGRGEVRFKLTAQALADVMWDQQILVAVFESGLETKIRSGERGGESLINDFTVRRLVPIFVLQHRAGSKKSCEVVIPVEAGWKRDRLGVAVFAQDPMTLKIEGATVASALWAG